MSTPRKNNVVRVKTNEEMLAEILPGITERVRKGGIKAAADDIDLAKYFGATITQVIGAIRAGKGLDE